MTLKPWRKSEDGRNSLNELAPHAHFALLTLLMLVCHSHIQIALRFASPGGLPAVWWGASQVLLHCKKKRGWQDRTWSDLLLAYLVMWNVASVALYAGFYPPA